MNKILTASLVFAVMLLMSVTAAAQWTVPRVIVQEILDYEGSYPDNIVYPEDGTISFRAFITSRPQYVLTEEHATSKADNAPNYFAVRFNLGNYPSLTGSPRDWSFGEIVRIEVVHNPTGRVGVAEFEIEEGSGPIFRRNELAIVLQDPPAESEDDEESEE